MHSLAARNVRLVLALAIAPFAGAFTTWAGLIIWMLLRNGWAHAPSDVFTLLYIPTLVALLLALPGLLVIGLLIHTVLMRFESHHSFGYVFGGAIAGLLFAALFSYAIPAHPTGLSMQNPLLALGAALGGSTAAYFWMIRRPDRDTPNPPTSTP
jgi:hypothetical protein